MTPPFTTAALLHRTFALLRAGAVRSLAALVLLSATAAAVDSGTLGEEARLTVDLLLSVGGIAVQYWLIRAALVDAGRGPASVGRFGAFFLMLIVSSLAILVGLVLLVVPGIVLIVRWWIAAPLLLDSDATVFDSLKQSWRETEGRSGPIFAVVAMLFAPALALFGVAVLLTPPDGSIGFAPALLVNAAIYGALIAGWHSAAAAYSFTSGGRETLASIFA